VSSPTTIVPEESSSGRFKILYRLLAALSKAGGLGEVYEAALSSLLDATEANRAAILLFDWPRNKKQAEQLGGGDFSQGSGWTVSTGKSPLGEVVSHSRSGCGGANG